jgi:hypothetical protein
MPKSSEPIRYDQATRLAPNLRADSYCTTNNYKTPPISFKQHVRSASCSPHPIHAQRKEGKWWGDHSLCGISSPLPDGLSIFALQRTPYPTAINKALSYSEKKRPGMNSLLPPTCKYMQLRRNDVRLHQILPCTITIARLAP